MKFKVEIGFMSGSKEHAIGDMLDEKDIPTKSKKWMLEQGIIVKKTEADLKREAEEEMQKLNENRVRARNDKGHYIADDPNTEVNEAWEEE
tara:strand:- start:1993 stop:2265 length:273 start_codon:yes stop_codon:yes gene_type:complete